MSDVDFSSLETFQNETGLVIFTENTGKCAFAPQTRGRDQSRGSQTAAVTFAPLNARLAVGAWILTNKKQLIHRGAAQS